MTAIETLERATLATWPAEHRATRHGWEFCASGAGHSWRTSSVWPLAWRTDATLTQAIAEAESWCAVRHIPLQFKLATGATAPSELPGVLAALGFVPENETLVMTRALGATAPFSGVTLQTASSDDIWRPLRESAPSPDDFAERRDIVLRISAPHIFALAGDQSAPAAIGLGVLSNSLVGIYLMRTAPEARRKGLARNIVRALLNWGAQHGAHSAYLQVEKANESAVALYESERFATRYSYFYWRRA